MSQPYEYVASMLLRRANGNGQTCSWKDVIEGSDNNDNNDN